MQPWSCIHKTFTYNIQDAFQNTPSECNLYPTNTTSTCSNLQLLRGRDGRDGQTGPPGRDGRDGLPGLPGGGNTEGQPGRDGLNGTQGSIGPQGPVGPAGPTIGGVAYTRWGNSACPNITGTELVYTGRAAGTRFNQQGGASNYLCLPMDPEYNLPSNAGTEGNSPVWGAEYHSNSLAPTDLDVPCAVCHVTTRDTVLMIPAKASCPMSWTEEYDGYIMSDYILHYRTMFVCVDRALESIPGTAINTDRVTFHNVEVDCTSLPCPPFNNEQELNCVVCTK